MLLQIVVRFFHEPWLQRLGNHSLRLRPRIKLPNQVTLPYLTLPYLTLPYLTLPYLTLPYLTLPYLTSPHLWFTPKRKDSILKFLRLEECFRKALFL